MLALALALLVALGFFLATALADLYPFNNVHNAPRSEQISEVLVNAPIITAPG